MNSQKKKCNVVCWAEDFQFNTVPIMGNAVVGLMLMEMKIFFRFTMVTYSMKRCALLK